MIRLRHGILSLIAAGSTASVLLVGCCNSSNDMGMRGQSCNDVAQGSLPDPCGLSVYSFGAIQKRNAEAVSYIVFTNEWYMGEQTLGPYGEHHVQHLATLLLTTPHNVIVQPSLDPTLNETRRQFVVSRLLQAGVLDAERRVRLEYADADRIYGEEAPRIFNNMLRSNQYGNQGAGSYFPGNVSGNAAGAGGFGGFGGIR
jgi:hypothetical protein